MWIKCQKENDESKEMAKVRKVVAEAESRSDSFKSSCKYIVIMLSSILCNIFKIADPFQIHYFTLSSLFPLHNWWGGQGGYYSHSFCERLNDLMKLFIQEGKSQSFNQVFNSWFLSLPIYHAKSQVCLST